MGIRHAILVAAEVSYDDFFHSTYGIPFVRVYHCDGRSSVSVMAPPHTIVLKHMTQAELGAVDPAIRAHWATLTPYHSVIDAQRQESIGDVSAMCLHYVGAILAEKAGRPSILYNYGSGRSGECLPVNWAEIYAQRHPPPGPPPRPGR